MNKMSCALMAIAIFGLAGCGSADDMGADNGVPAGELPNAMMPGMAMNGGAMNGGAMNAAGASGATAAVQKSDGTSAGTATAREMDGALQISLNLEGLPSGPRGVHIHMTGRCDPPDFTSAGSHWNPTDAQHGLENPQGQHAGDMPNLEVGEDGRGTLQYTLKGATLAGLLDSDGSALVVHEGPDDQKTDPSGDSGGRIACGMFQADQ